MTACPNKTTIKMVRPAAPVSAPRTTGHGHAVTLAFNPATRSSPGRGGDHPPTSPHRTESGRPLHALDAQDEQHIPAHDPYNAPTANQRAGTNPLRFT